MGDSMTLNPLPKNKSREPRVSVAKPHWRALVPIGLVLTLLCQEGTCGQNNVWEPIGLSDGIVQTLAVDPRSDRVIYAGTDAGLYKTADGGATWRLSDGGVGGSIRALLVVPFSPDTVYAGTERGGILKSTDAGARWEPKNSGLTDLEVWTLAIHPQDSSLLFAGTWGGGLFRSEDGGETWSPVTGGLSGTILRSVVFLPANPRVIFAATQDAGIFKSTDGGIAWRESNEGIHEDWIRTIVPDPHSATTLYAAGYGGMSRSTDGGGHWQNITPEAGLNSIWGLACDPRVPGRVLVAAGWALSITLDGGETWRPFNEGLRACLAEVVLFLPGDSGYSLAGTNRGAYRARIGCSLDCETTVPPRVQVGVPDPFHAMVAPLLCDSSVSYLWNFGDGGASSDPAPTHAYSVPGTYLWNFTATADGVAWSQVGATKATLEPPCRLTCSASGPGTGPAGIPLPFTASADATGTCPGSPSYWWDFGDGSTSQEQNPSHSYASEGWYRWGLTSSLDGLPCSHEGGVSVLPQDGYHYLLLGHAVGTAGDAVRVPIAIERNAGYAGAVAADIAYGNSGLEPFAVEPSPELRELGFEIVWHDKPDGILRLGLVNVAAPRVIPDGVVAYASFKVPDDAEGTFPLGLVASAASSAGVDIPMGAIDGSVTVRRPPIGVSVGWSPPGRAECSPPENLTTTVIVPGGGGPGRRVGRENSASTWEGAAEGRGVLLGYDLYRATAANPSAFTKLNPALIPAGTPGFFDESPPSGSVAYRAQAVYDSCTSDYSPPAPAQVPPCAIGSSASSEPASGTAPLAVSFVCTAQPSSGCSGNVTYEWDFGDGSHSSEEAPIHTYTSDGVYPWVLTVRVGGVSSTRSGIIVVGAVCAVSCRATATPSTGLGPLAVTFAAAATPGAYCTGPTLYRWTFGDGGSSTEPNPTHLYPSEGEYDWGLTVSSGDASSSQTGAIQVCSLTCEASSSPGSGLPPLAVSFAAEAILSPHCEGAAFYSWDFGDGGTSIVQNPTHLYDRSGDFSWTVTANANGMTRSQSGTVHACTVSCSAAASPASGTLPLQVAFTSTAEVDGDCAWSPTYSWVFGDGGTARTREASHTYAAEGTYTWSFTATDGLTCSETGTVHVSCDTPLVTSIRRLTDPFRLRVDAEGLKEGFAVFVGGDTVPWPDMMVKSPTRFVIKNAGRYFPRGDVWVRVRIANPSGCDAEVEYNWGRNQWRIAR